MKDPDKRMKRQVIGWEKIFTNHVSDNRLISRFCTELSKFNSKKNKQSLENGKNLQTCHQRGYTDG